MKAPVEDPSAEGPSKVSLSPLGDAAVLIHWGGLGRVGDPMRVAAVERAVRAAKLKGVTDVVPAPASVLVRFDPRRTRAAALDPLLQELATVDPSPTRPKPHRLAVRYGGADGPDLGDVAERLRLSPEEVIERHAAATYTVLATGFAPGFVYLGPLPESLRLPRREEPRVSVPAGSIAIADAQTGIYGIRSGGGWWLIGRTTTPTFHPEKRQPSAYSIGDEVLFEASR